MSAHTVHHSLYYFKCPTCPVWPAATVASDSLERKLSKTVAQGWRHGPVVSCTGCPSRGPLCNFDHFLSLLSCMRKGRKVKLSLGVPSIIALLLLQASTSSYSKTDTVILCICLFSWRTLIFMGQNLVHINFFFFM